MKDKHKITIEKKMKKIEQKRHHPQSRGRAKIQKEGGHNIHLSHKELSV